jgi:hypothetical protein
LRAWSANPDLYAERIVDFFLDEPRRLKIGYAMWGGGGSAEDYVSRQAVRLCSIRCAENKFRDLERVILTLRDRWESTLFKLVRVRDSNAYAETQNALEWLHNLGVTRKIAILGLHHSRKRLSDDQRTSEKTNGSTTIAAASMNLLDLNRKVASDPKSQRVLRMNEFRYGEGMEPTVLDFDTSSQRYTIAETLSHAKGREAEEAKSEVKQRVLHYVQAHPGSTEKEIRQGVVGRVQRMNEALRSALDTGLVRRDGGGTKNDPYRYFPADVRHDELPVLQGVQLVASRN